MKIDPNILSQAAGCFGIELSGLRPLGGMEGMALEYIQGNTRYVLKVTQGDKNNLEQTSQVKAKIEFITHLAENGVQVAKPVPSPAGNWVEIVETDDKLFLVTAATKAAGKHVNLRNPTQSTTNFFLTWGRMTGQMQLRNCGILSMTG